MPVLTHFQMHHLLPTFVPTFLPQSLTSLQPSTTSRRPIPCTSRASISPTPATAPTKPSKPPPAPKPRDLDIVLCHATADFDSLAAAVGLAKLRGPNCRVVVPAGVHTAVKKYLTLHKSFFPLLDVKAVDPDRLRWVAVVDTHSLKRLGVAAQWLQNAPHVCVLDHHIGSDPSDISQHSLNGDLEFVIEPVGAITTVVVERLALRHDIRISQAEASLLALGIHTDTGSLTFENTTPRDAASLSWLLARGACQRSISQFARNYLTQQQQKFLSNALDCMTIRNVDGLSVAHVILQSDQFVKGMASVAQSALEIADLDALILAVVSPSGRKKDDQSQKQVSLICRARSSIDGVDFNELLQSLGGGGHAKAASASVKVKDVGQVDGIVDQLVENLVEQIPPPVLAKDFMSRNVIAILPTDSMARAAEVLFDSGHTGLAVVQSQSGEELVGVVSRQDVELSERRGLLHTPVKGWVARKVVSVGPDTPLHVVEAKLVDNNIGRLPVVLDGKVIGIVTRSDVLVQRRLCSPFQ